MTASASTGPAIAPRVLVIDDSESQIEFLQRVLEPDGFKCYSVTDGRQAFDACVSVAPDVILLDVQLPGSDGLSVCRQLKRAPETRLTPVIIMTGLSASQAQLEALEAGADDFMAKPIRLAELTARVRSAAKLKRSIDELDDAAASIVMLGATIEARDPSTGGHCQRLADYARQLGTRIGLGHPDLRALELGGYLHDLGKIVVPDAVLFKPGPLTVEEYAIVKTHPEVGERLCAPLRTLRRVWPIIRSHHERLDGHGYPDGLTGAAVPLLAQIIAIADVFDALTTNRPYRPALLRDVACEMLVQDAAIGKYDRELVAEFIAVVDVGNLRPKLAPAKPLSSVAVDPLQLELPRCG